MTRAGALAPLLAAALGACSAPSASGTRWPKSAGTVEVADWEEDGGQSLAPRAGTPAVEATADRRAEPELAAMDAGPQEQRAAPATATPEAPTASERELQEELDAIELQESIIIEIED